MGEFSIWHWLIVLLVVMLLFGSGKVSGLMGDFAKGIKTFKKSMAEDDTPTAPPQAGPLEAASPIAEPASVEQAPRPLPESGPVSVSTPEAASKHPAASRETTPAH
jgi:sec-independent protein translocase protein TatA